jgi:hypothetical protein
MKLILVAEKIMGTLKTLRQKERLSASETECLASG